MRDSLPTSAEARPLVLVPVCGQARLVSACLDSLAAAGSEVLVLLDGPQDRDVLAVVEQAESNRLRVERSAKRRGFTSQVNRGFELAGARDVVLLNSDTRVPSTWLDGLERAVRSSPDVATATPLSNNAGVFSIPLPAKWSERPEAVDEINRLLFDTLTPRYPEVPTGHGFCLFVRGEARVQAGHLDLAFRSGYGSENDFCLRCSMAGWRHVAADDVYVFHHGSGSTGSLRRRWANSVAQARLRRRYPGYWSQVAGWMADRPLAHVERVLNEC